MVEWSGATQTGRRRLTTTSQHSVEEEEEEAGEEEEEGGSYESYYLDTGVRIVVVVDRCLPYRAGGNLWCLNERRLDLLFL